MRNSMQNFCNDAFIKTLSAIRFPDIKFLLHFLGRGRKKQTNHETRKEKKLLKLFKIFTLFKAGVKYCDITEKQDKKISNLWFDMFLYLPPSMPTWVTHSYALSSFLPYWSQNIYETAQGGKMLMWQLILLPVSNTLPQVVFLSLC